MGLLDKSLGLPTLSGGGLVPNSSVNYAIGDVSTLVNESYSALQSKYGGTANFTSLNQGAPTFQEIGAAITLGNSIPSAYLGTASIANVTTSQATASDIKANVRAGSGTQDDSHKVKLVSTVDDLVVVFEVTPEVTEGRNVEYEALSIPHAPGDFQKYRGTKSTTWQINGQFTARNTEEADTNYKYLLNLRTWTMPYFGEQQAGRLLGAPPPVLNFSGWRSLVGEVPVVLVSLNWSWPKDCDWLPTYEVDGNGQAVPFPSVMNVAINLVESFSAQQFNNFDLLAFSIGEMVGAFPAQRTTGQVVSEANSIGNSTGTGEASEYTPGDGSA